MVDIVAKRGNTVSRGDCLTCGTSNGASWKKSTEDWARRHVVENPDHQVHVLTESVRIFKAKA